MPIRSILVVDDDRDLSRMVKLTLEGTGAYRVRVLNDPAHALKTALELMPDLILLDVIMPGMDGGTLAARIREQKSLRDTPILFFTSIVDKGEVSSRGGRIGNEPMLAKPVSADELLAAVRKLIP